jgi:Fe-S-cluster containining protein
MCCGPVPITASQRRKILGHLRSLPPEERLRLHLQHRGDLNCGFLDTATYRCTIYPVRPFVCEAFGRVEDLECPKIGRLVQIIPAIIAEDRLRRETAEPAIAASIQWNWKKMDFE